MKTQTLHTVKKGAVFGFSGGSLLKTATGFLMAAVWCTGAAADSLPPQIQMEMVTEMREPGVVKAMILDDDKVSKATLFYRKPGEIRFNSIEMKERNDVWYRELKRDLGLDGTVEYYILAQDKSGNETTSPAVNPTERPLRAAMDPIVNQSAEEVVLSSPEAGTVILSGDQIVIVTFYKTDREADMSTVRIKIDDRDRTREAEIKGNMLVWQPRRPLPDGLHMIEILANDTSGNSMGPNVWTFEVKSKFQLPLGTKGNFYMGLQHYDRSVKSAGQVPLWNNKIDVGLKGEKGQLSWETGIMLTSEESSFLTSEKLDKVQPVNRYYATLRSRNFRLHLGDDNPNFSDLSVKGILVRGISASFKSNRFNADFLRGFNKRDIGEEIEVMQGISNVTATGYFDENSQAMVDISAKPYQRIVQDSSGEYHVYEFSPGTFRRNVTALKLDTAPLRNKYFSWNFGVNLFAAEDDTTSLDYVYNSSDQTRSYRFDTGRESTLFTTGYTPRKNWVGTFETALRFNQNRSVLSAEFGGTMATDNLFGVVTDDIRDELPEDIDDKLFRFNGSTQTSFDKMKIKDDIGGGIADAMTSVYLIRLVTPVPVPKLNTRFKGEVFRIPTHYVSLGNPHQRTDMGGLRFDVRTQFLKDQVSLDLGYETYADNLDNERKQYASVDKSVQKDLTKETQTASFSVGFRPRILPEYAPNMSIGYRAYTAANDLDTAYNPVSKEIDMSTNTLMLNLGATLPVGLQRHTGTISFSGMTIGDNRPIPDYDRNESENNTVLLNVSSALNPLPFTLNTTIGMTGNTSYFRAGSADTPFQESITTDILLLNLAGTYKWFRDRRFATTAGLGYIGSSNGAAEQNRKVDNTKLTLRFEADYKLNEMTVLGGNLRFINYSDAINSSMEYTEPIIGVTVKSNF
jgi:hypothetical protein